MALKFRRGTTAQKSGSLAFGEPYVNTTLGTLQIGGESGDITLLINSASQGISGSSLNITGNAKIDGNLTLGGNITIGDQTSDTVTVTANLSSSLIPSVTNAFDLGSPTKIWKDLYLSTASIKLVDGNGNIVNTITNENIVTTDSIASGSITLTNSLPAGTVSGSAQVVGILSSLNSYTGSNDTLNTLQTTRIDQLASSTASVNSKISQLETDSGSQNTRITTLESKATTLQTYTASVDTDLTELFAFSGSAKTSITDLQTKATTLQTYTASVDTKFSTLQTLTASVQSQISRIQESTASLNAFSASNANTSLNSFTSSINTTIKNKLDTDGVISGSSQVTLASTTGFTSYSSSVDSRILTEKGRVDAILLASDADKDSFAEIVSLINSVDTTNDNTFASFYTASVNRLNNLESTSGSSNISISNINSFTSSINTTIKEKLNVETVVSSSAQVVGILAALNTYTASNDTTNNTQNSRLDQLSTASGSAISRLTAVESETLNLELYTGSFATASVTLSNKTISGASNTLSNIGNSSLTNSSITIAGQSTALGGTITAETIRTAIGTVVTGSSQINFTGLSGISANIISASSDTSNVDMIINGGSISANLYGGVVSGSAQVVGMLASLNTYTASNDTTNTNQSNKLSRLEESTASLNAYTASNDTKWSTLGSLSGSFARTNSANIFNGNQTITGSLFISADLIVAGSSSIQNISSSRLDIGDNIIQLNVNNPSLRFGGLAIYDSGSAGSSGSFLYDSLHDEFIFVHKGNGLNVTSSHFVLGPETYDNLGTETYLTNNRVPKGSGKEHLNDSNITDTGTLITLGSNSVVNGTFYATGTTLVSGSSQISHDSTTGYSANKHIDHTAVSITAGSGLSGGGDISATRTLSIATGGVTDSMLAGSISNAKLTNSSITIAGQSTALGSSVTAETIRTAIGTVVTGSSQIDLTATTNYASGILTRLNVVGVFSGSSQVSHDSTTGYSANRHIDHTAVSITAGSGLTGGGDISTTRTISIANLGVTDAMLAGSISNAKLSNSAITIAGQSTSLGSSVTAETIRTAIGTVVTGSAQIAIASTSGFGTYINQAVLTTSSPTFAGLTINGSITATGDITAYYTSDKRHKNNIQIIPNALQKVSKLNGVTWEWNDDVNEVTKSTPKTGLIAQEVQEVLPEVVKEREDGFLSLDYSKMTGLLVEAIKEQQSQIHKLTLEIENLKKQKGL